MRADLLITYCFMRETSEQSTIDGDTVGTADAGDTVSTADAGDTAVDEQKDRRMDADDELVAVRG